MVVEVPVLPESFPLLFVSFVFDFDFESDLSDIPGEFDMLGEFVCPEFVLGVLGDVRVPPGVLVPGVVEVPGLVEVPGCVVPGVVPPA